ncbi:BQ5605_C002g01423 [Microbotryum silenes-dioicae]|uniref:BQ5605_C002g01423 protein n=1 Tax=Microbotryum silenes-dioicae TaxID=796604 RepID=A0A2X0LYR9_9BASI|nr:BQ5605_C002g01423 [Microbotryum silenes-dioicae]
MGESRTELIAWLNDLLQIQYTKVEQCGNCLLTMMCTGAAYCQVIDSIFGDVPMKKVKMSSRGEHEHVLNYKVLQNSFKSHNIDKPIPVDRLIKCKMQDNLEFLQWLKKFWDQSFPGGEYDPIGRRQGLGIEPPPMLGARGRTPVNAPAPAPVRRAGTSSGPTGAARRPVGVASAGRPASTTSSARSGPSATEIAALNAQMEDMKITVDSMEKERSFYYEKLRSIEILIGARLESEDETITESEMETLKAIETVLYSTEEGFEVPEDEGEELVEGVEGDEEETF